MDPTPTAPPRPAGGAAPIVEVDGLVRTFGSVRALDGVGLAVEPGIVFALLGPNGAGKTTLIRVLATLLRPDRGAVRIAGVDVVADPAAARARIGLAGQFAAVDEYLTGRENVQMVGRLYGLNAREAVRRADEVLERIGLARDAERRVGTYSGGMRRRLDLAASLVGRPQVMFLDEPTTGIDPRSRLGLWELIDELVAAGTTVVLTTQYLDEADRLAHRIAVIDQGRIVSEGSSDELKDALGGAVLELGIDSQRREPAVVALRGATGAEPVVDADGTRLRLPAREGARTVALAVRALSDAGVEPTELALHKPTLDDVFLALTGEDLAAASGSGQHDDAGPGPGGAPGGAPGRAARRRTRRGSTPRRSRRGSTPRRGTP